MMSEKNFGVSSDIESNNQLEDKELGYNKVNIKLDYEAVQNGNNENALEQRNIHKIEKKSTYKETALTMIKAFIGSGVLALPFSFYEGGYILSTFVFILISLLINYQQVNLVILADQYRSQDQQLDYCKLIALTLGDRMKNFSKVFIIIMQIGCCTSYIIFFMKFFEFALYDGDNPTIEHSLKYLGLAFLIIIPMTFISDIAVFTKTSAFANVLIAVALTVISIQAISQVANNENNEESKAAKIEHLSTVVGVAIYSFEAIGIILNVQSSMERKEKFKRLLQCVTGVVVIMNILFSAICSIGFGSATNQIVLFNIGSSPFMSLIQVCYALALVLSFPLQLFPQFEIVEDSTAIKQFLHSSPQNYLFKRSCIRIGQVFLIGLIALGVPEFAVFLSFVGGIGGTGLQFGFPLLVYYKVQYSKKSQKENLMFCSAMGLGICLGAYATIDSFIQIVT